MEPKFQSSFIPKAPIVSSSTAAPIQRPHTTNVFAVAAGFIFVVTLAASGGEIVYKNILTNQIAEADQELIQARADFQPEKIKELVTENAQIGMSKKLLDKHVAVSEVLALLEALTVKRMRFTAFSYEDKTTSQTVSISGVAENYNALAEQETIFSSSKFIKNPDFSNFNLDENGNVKVDFFATLDSNLVSYKQALGITDKVATSTRPSPQFIPPGVPPVSAPATTTATTSAPKTIKKP